MNQVAQQGYQLYTEGKFDEAEAELSRYVTMNPGDAGAWRVLGCAQYGLGKHPEATINLQKAVAINPSDAENHYALGMEYGFQQQIDQAVGCFDQALTLNPQHELARKALSGALMHRAEYRFSLSDHDHGEADLERAAKIDRQNPAPHKAHGCSRSDWA